MSDFLGNLIARTAQRAPVLERRRRAIFEPAGRTIDSLSPIDDRADASSGRTTVQPVVAGSARERSGPVGAQIAARPRTDAERSNAPSGRAPAPAPNEAAAKARSTRTPVEDVTPRTPAHYRTAVAVAMTSSTRQVIAEEKSVEPSRLAAPVPLENDALRPRIPAVIDARKRALVRPTGATQDHPGRPVDLSDPHASSRASRTIGIRVSEGGANGRVKAAPQAIPQAVYLAGSKRTTRQSESAPPARSVPAVYVTIGRVEVRATAPSERAIRPAQPVAPRLTLDDYLRKRSGTTR